MRGVVLAAALAAVAGAGCKHSVARDDHAPAGAAGSSTPAPEARPRTTAELLHSMAQLVGFVADRSYLDQWAGRIDRGEATVDAYIDEILGTERFAGDIVPSLMFGAYVNVRNYWALPIGYVLKRDGDGPYYLRGPCTPAEATVVNPWWDLAAEVRICPDSYRPDKWSMTTAEQSYRTKMVMECDSQIGSPEAETASVCGCGPNLIRCVRDMDQYDEINRSLITEVKRTTAWVVQHDMPIASLFTTNETFRDRNVEAYYRRQKIGSLESSRVPAELADLVTWPQTGKWAPRGEVRPGMHAGVLTSPQILHWLPDRRQRQRAYYEILWCNLKNSFGATTHKVLELNGGNNFFVYNGWQKLAHTDLCTNCHARLDYGFQFFLGYPDSRASTHYVPALQSTATGELYGRDIDDKRGEAPLLPIEFAKLATAQPEFNECMTSHFASYVLGERATPEDMQAISDVVARVGTVKAPMKLALELYAKKWRDEAGATTPAPAPTTPIAAASAAGRVRVSPELRSLIDKECSDCHDQAPYSDDPDGDNVAYDFRGADLPRPLVVGMLDKVAFGMMPKKQPLVGAAREKAVHLLVDTLWAEADARAEAEAYYLGRKEGVPAQDVDNALYAIGLMARTETGSTWGLIERAIWSEQSTVTPGFLATTGLEALRACTKTSGRRLDILEACLQRATALDVLSRWPPPSTSP